MNAKLSTGLLALLVSMTAATTVDAKPISIATLSTTWSTSQNTTRYTLSPFALVHLAEGGRLEAQRIKGGQSFRTQNNFKREKAERLVQAAIQSGLLPAETANDQDYIKGVMIHLKSLQLR
jgi:NaMN:DMB phosphoribosyltransferase